MDFFVATRVPGLDLGFRLAARSALVHRLAARSLGPGLAIARRLGSSVGCLAFETEAADGRIARCALIGGERGHLTPVVPAVLAARALATGNFAPTGLVPADQQTRPEELFACLESLGIRAVSSSSKRLA